VLPADLGQPVGAASQREAHPPASGLRSREDEDRSEGRPAGQPEHLVIAATTISDGTFAFWLPQLPITHVDGDPCPAPDSGGMRVRKRVPST